MFLFEDLATVEDRCIQRILREVEQEGPVLALKGKSDAISRLFCATCRSAWPRWCGRTSALRVPDAEAAQQRIVALARRLEAARSS